MEIPGEARSLSRSKIGFAWWPVSLHESRGARVLGDQAAQDRSSADPFAAEVSSSVWARKYDPGW